MKFYLILLNLYHILAFPMVNKNPFSKVQPQYKKNYKKYKFVLHLH